MAVLRFVSGRCLSLSVCFIVVCWVMTSCVSAGPSFAVHDSEGSRNLQYSSYPLGFYHGHHYPHNHFYGHGSFNNYGPYHQHSFHNPRYGNYGGWRRLSAQDGTALSSGPDSYAPVNASAKPEVADGRLNLLTEPSSPFRRLFKSGHGGAYYGYPAYGGYYGGYRAYPAVYQSYYPSYYYPSYGFYNGMWRRLTPYSEIDGNFGEGNESTNPKADA